MSLLVLQAGALATIQDCGRFHYQQFGVGPSGAMDIHMLKVANTLVGNRPCSPAIELMVGGTSFLVEQTMLIAICGYGMSVIASRGDEQAGTERVVVPMWRPVIVEAGMRLYCSPTKKGLTAYIALPSGVQAPLELGSSSTASRSKLGGLASGGQSLVTGDRITYQQPSEQSIQLFKLLERVSAPNWYVNYTYYAPQTTTVIRILTGTQFADLTEQSKHRFLHTTFRISSQSDRMGYRIAGERLKVVVSEELISEPVTTGTIQLPPSGEPIILMADRQTTGGYPRIAHVCTVDLAKLAQLKTGDEVTFEIVSLQEAEALLKEQAESLAQLTVAMKLKLGGIIELSTL